jgi:mRNA interferase HicA
MYNIGMKKRDLEKQLTAYGWRFLRHGGKHDVWTNGEQQEQIPRHTEIAEVLAKKILRTAWRHYAPKKDGGGKS